jgi:hypothetical protein
MTSSEGIHTIDKLLVKLDVQELKIREKIFKLKGDRFLKNDLLKNVERIIRIYAIEGRNFASRDFDSPSDPYLIIQLGK